MLDKLLENYNTANGTEDACEKDWCISPMPAKVQQVKLKFNKGKSYDYACRYNANPNAIAVVGWTFPELNGDIIDSSAKTGCMGQAIEVLPTLTIKRSHAVEIDFVFNVDPAKKDLTQCVKYLKLNEESYEKTLQLDKELTPIRPISYHIRRILAAASILAHPKFVYEEDLTLARTVILEPKCIDARMSCLTAVIPEDIGVALSDVHVPDDNIRKAFEEIAKELDYNKNWRADEGYLHNISNIVRKFSKLDIVNEFVNKYAHYGAISVMIRGGFSNLLNAYLAVNPPIDSFLNEMLTVLDGVGYAETYEILKAYKK